MEQSRGPRAATPGSWKPGQSGNPKGRPRVGLALAEAIREKIDPDGVAEMVERYRTDESIPLERRLAVLLPWVHAGYLKPPVSHDVNVNNGSAARDLSHLSADELRELLAKVRGPTALESGDTGTSPAADEAQPSESTGESSTT